MAAVRITLHGNREREKVRKWLSEAPDLSRVTLDEPKRSFEQNSALWPALTDISKQLDWHGQKYTPDDWKDYMMHALKRARWMPSEDGGMVPIGMSTSKMGWHDFSDLLELVKAFGARHGVVFHEPENG